MTFMDFIHSVGSGISSVVDHIGKGVSGVMTPILNTGTHIFDKAVDVGSGIVNKVVDIGGNVADKGIGIVSKGADTLGSVGSTLSLVPLLMIGVGGFVLYKLIDNVEPVGRAVSSTATAVAPLVAQGAKFAM